jgi:hypothetical protein
MIGSSWDNHRLRRRPLCFMVGPAQVTHLGQAGSPRCGRGTGKRRLACPPNRMFGGMGFGEGRCPLLPCHRPRRAGSAPGIGCRDRAGRQSTSPGANSGRQGLIIVGSMILFGQALTNPASIPIFQGGMTCCRSARPDHVPILERTGKPPFTRLFRRPPVRIPQGSAPRRGAAYRSSVLNDQAYVDRFHARGRDPRRGAGW